MEFDQPLTTIKGVGEIAASKFERLGVRTIRDLLYNTPRRYDDYSQITPITRLRPGVVTIKCTIKQAKGRYVRRGMHVTEAVASDDTGSVRLVWFNQPYRVGALKANTEYFVRGEFALRRQYLSIQNPSVELVSDFPINAARIVPTYKLTKGLSSLQISRAVRSLVPYIKVLPETLPSWLVEENKLLSASQAIMALHFPDNISEIDDARKRFGFEEVFSLQLAALLNKSETAATNSLKVPFIKAKAQSFVEHLPFALTDSQRRTVWQIYKDMQQPHPMNRIVEGDVGSGKTVVACMAALMAMEAGLQVVLMAPTEILARQHAETVHGLLRPLQLESKVSLLVGGMTSKQKATTREHIKSGKVGFIVGTHAVLQESVALKNLGLVIIDEQHRFGVEQRKALLSKAGHLPHMLALTATPIPRSLALTLYGELDISLLKDKPLNRQTIITKIASPNSRKELATKVMSELDSGRQVFIVCPSIIEQDEESLLSVEQVFRSTKKEFPNHRVGMLHGRMKSVEKDNTMQAFSRHEIDILVSTTVIEVGVDVPNASVMIVESAEQFGLAQLHQLRGRVGRGEHKSYCYLMTSDSRAPSQRLRALERSTDGFALAEMDLEIRGPGAIYGTLQHGALDLRYANLSDGVLIKSARAAAEEFMNRNENLLEYEILNSHIQRMRAVTNLH